MTYVQTVTGKIDASELGRVLCHEHLLTLLPGPWLSGGVDAAGFDEEQVAIAVTAVSGLAALGFRTVVDLSPYGDAGRSACGENVALLREIAERSGLTIVSGTATYRQEFSPQWTIDATVDELVDRFMADATTGIGNTDVQAGILGEQPTSLDAITPHEEKGLRAAARASHATGLAISTHTTHGTMALEQIDLLEEEHVDLTRVIVGHMDNHPDLDYLRRVLDRGVNIGFDSIGKQYWDVRVPPRADEAPDGEYTKQAIQQSDRTRAVRLGALVAEGYRSQIVLSQDLTGGQVSLNPTTHGRHGYTYLGSVFAELLADHGVTEADLDIMLRTNPTRLLTVDI
jgi:predicted metal-dependent phosphotriesterase family hydrolase